MAFMKTMGLVLMAVLPGGLVFLMAFVLARAVAQRMEAEQGNGPQRFGRALATVRWNDFLREARRL